jgi:hypothetical protein
LALKLLRKCEKVLRKCESVKVLRKCDHCCCCYRAFGSHVAEKVLAGLHQQAEELIAAEAEDGTAAAAAAAAEDAEDGNAAAAAGTLEALLGSMVGAIGEAAVLLLLLLVRKFCIKVMLRLMVKLCTSLQVRCASVLLLLQLLITLFSCCAVLSAGGHLFDYIMDKHATHVARALLVVIAGRDVLSPVAKKKQHQHQQHGEGEEGQEAAAEGRKANQQVGGLGRDRAVNAR